MQLDLIIDQIREYHRVRCYAMEQRKRANLALGSLLRLVLGWSLALPEADRTRIKAQSQSLIKLGEEETRALKKRKKALAALSEEDASELREHPPFETDEPDYLKWRDTILASIGARGPFSDMEKDAAKEMERLARELPVWEWCEPIRGFGAVSLAVIVGEAGDLSNYPRKGHLWKRMGLAVIGDIRQGGLKKTAAKEDWIVHGYNRQRRSRVWNIGDSLIKGNGDGVYRQAYLARKEYERDRAEAAGLTVAPAAKIPKGRAAEFMSDGHIHRRAQRYMEKRLLRDLWQAWRRANHCELIAIQPLPIAA